MKRVVITGYGVICALGNNKRDVKAAFMNRDINMKPISQIKEYGELNQIYAGLCKHEYKEIKKVTDYDRSEEMARIALDEACADAKLTKENLNDLKERLSLSLSTSVMGSDYIMNYMKEGRRNAEWIIHSKAFVSRLARDYRIHGGCYTTSSACASGSAGIGIAFDLIKEDKADMVITGGTDHVTDISIYGFHALETLSHGIAKPFDQERDGINIGEGSAFFIFEEYEHAKRRNAVIYGEVLGYGLANDAYHITSPDPSGEGASHSMRMALAEAKFSKDTSRLYINAHGTGTRVNDAMELKAIKKVFGEQSVYVSSTKSLTGHCLGAAGSIELALSLMVLEEGRAPITANSKFDIEDHDAISDREIEVETVNTILSNSFAFGGNDATVVIEACN